MQSELPKHSPRPPMKAWLLAGGLAVACSGAGSDDSPARLTSGGSTSGGQADPVATSGGHAQLAGGSSSSRGGKANSGGAATVELSSSSAGDDGDGGTSTGATNSGGGPSRGGSSGGTTTGGTTTGGTTTGSTTAGGTTTGGTTTGGTTTGGTTTGGAPAIVAPGVSKDAEGQMALSGLTVVSYGGYLNGESFQQEGIVTHNGFQYTAFWNTNRHVVLARRKLPSGAWEKFEFTDYTLAAEDAHNTISLGVAPGDGTLHIAFDHHSNNLHYRRSTRDILSDPANTTWDMTSFSAVSSSLVGTTTIALVTYPRFVIEPGGKKLLFSSRIGSSGSGDEYLWEYDTTAHSWVSLGKYLDGTSNPSATVNAYLHGLAYTRGGSRLHASWCWRETPDATTNHDLVYVYSDDHGRTWKNNAGTTVAVTGSSYVTTSTAGTRVWTINQNRGLINQEHMTVDSTGRVHVLLGHLPDGLADDSDFTSARTKSRYYHYFRDLSGTWTRRAIADLPVVVNFRGKLAVSSSNNLYAVLPDLRIAGASASDNFATWTLLDSKDSGRFFSDPLIDSVRLETEDRLTVYYPQKSSVNIWTLDYTLQ